MMTFSINEFDVCVTLEDETLEATDQEIKLPKGSPDRRLWACVWRTVFELVCTYCTINPLSGPSDWR